MDLAEIKEATPTEDQVSLNLIIAVEVDIKATKVMEAEEGEPTKVEAIKVVNHSQRHLTAGFNHMAMEPATMPAVAHLLSRHSPGSTAISRRQMVHLIRVVIDLLLQLDPVTTITPRQVLQSTLVIHLVHNYTALQT